MRNCFSSPKVNKKSDFSTCDCECNCHSPEEMHLSSEDFIKNKRKVNKSYLSQSQIIARSKDSSDSECEKIYVLVKKCVIVLVIVYLACVVLVCLIKEKIMIIIKTYIIK